MENDEPPLKGKANCLEMERLNFEKVSSFRQRITTLVIDEAQETVMGEMEIKFESKNHGKKTLNEAFVQKWRDGKIYYQRFYYQGFLDDAS